MATFPATAAPAAFAAPSKAAFTTSTGKVQGQGRAILLYGTGGAGKTTLASKAPSPVFLDIEGSANEYDVHRIVPPAPWNYESVLDALRTDSLFVDAKTIVIDSATKLEQLCAEHVVRTGGEKVQSLEDIGYGKGWQRLFESFVAVISATERHLRAGRNIIWIAHESVTKAINPFDDDYFRYEPRLFTPSNGKATNSIRYRLKEEVSEVWFLAFAVAVNDKDGKPMSGGARVLHTVEHPGYLAKSRKLTASIVLKGVDDATPWTKLLGENA